jgi:hypothetical protein
MGWCCSRSVQGMILARDPEYIKHPVSIDRHRIVIRFRNRRLISWLPPQHLLWGSLA